MTDRLVAVVGSLAVDVTVRLPRRPLPGETVRGDSSALTVGGKGANQAVMCALVGATTAMVGCVGDDTFGRDALSALRLAGVEVRAVHVTKGATTGMAQIRVDHEGQNDIVTVRGANDLLRPEDVDQALEATKPTVLLIQLETPMECVIQAIRHAHAMGACVVFDPAPAMSIPAEIWSCVDVVTPNEREAEAITGIRVTGTTSAVEAGRWFRGRGVGTAIITRGADGVVVVDESGFWAVTGDPVTAVDTTGAGDAFAGALAARLALDPQDTRSAVAWGVAAGGLSVTRAGACSSFPAGALVAASAAKVKQTEGGRS